MDVKDAKKVLRRNDAYTPQEIVACFFALSTQRGWPITRLKETLKEFDDEERERLESVAALVLADMQSNCEGFQHGYMTTEEGDFKRIAESAIISREFIEALCSLC